MLGNFRTIIIGACMQHARADVGGIIRGGHALVTAGSAGTMGRAKREKEREG
jgi:hypothetical protein